MNNELKETLEELRAYTGGQYQLDLIEEIETLLNNTVDFEELIEIIDSNPYSHDLAEKLQSEFVIIRKTDAVHENCECCN